MAKVRGYVDTVLIKKVQEKYPNSKTLKSTSDIIQFVFLKVLEPNLIVGEQKAKEA